MLTFLLTIPVFYGFNPCLSETYEPFSMGGRLTFLVIMPGTGRNIRFSLHKSIIYFVCIMSVLLLASGMIGMVKYQENIHLKNQCKLLAAEKNKMEAIARTVQDIERESAAIKNMLGLNVAPKKTQTP